MQNAAPFDLGEVEFDEPDETVADTDGGRSAARHSRMLGGAKPSTLGDMHALNQLCDRQARLLRDGFEPLLRRQPRVVPEAIRVERFDEYCGTLSTGLVSLNLLKLSPLAGQAMVAMEASFVLALVDVFFGGSGVPPVHMPVEFTSAEEAIIRRAMTGIVDALGRSWVELAELSFAMGATESSTRMLSHLDGDDMVIVTPFELTMANGRTTQIDVVYPLTSLKPLAPVLGSKVQSKRADSVDPAWRRGLTRVVMGVKLPVRSVLAEPVVPLSVLMDLKPGDVIPIELAPDVPLLVAQHRFGHGIVGQANGRTAIRIDRIDPGQNEDNQ